MSGDRFDELVAREPQHTHLDKAQHAELRWLLWEAHDGDERCGCLRIALAAAMGHDEVWALEVLRNCIAEHPAGLTYRTYMTSQLEAGVADE